MSTLSSSALFPISKIVAKRNFRLFETPLRIKYPYIAYLIGLMPYALGYTIYIGVAARVSNSSDSLLQI